MGLAKKIVHHLLDQAHGLGAIHATLEVASNNIEGKSLYKSCGFATAGYRHKYYSDGSDAIIQWISLKKRQK